MICCSHRRRIQRLLLCQYIMISPLPTLCWSIIPSLSSLTNFTLISGSCRRFCKPSWASWWGAQSRALPTCQFWITRHKSITVGVKARILHSLQTEPRSQLGTGDREGSAVCLGHPRSGTLNTFPGWSILRPRYNQRMFGAAVFQVPIHLVSHLGIN